MAIASPEALQAIGRLTDAMRDTPADQARIMLEGLKDEITKNKPADLHVAIEFQRHATDERLKAERDTTQQGLLRQTITHLDALDRQINLLQTEGMTALGHLGEAARRGGAVALETGTTAAGATAGFAGEIATNFVPNLTGTPDNAKTIYNHLFEQTKDYGAIKWLWLAAGGAALGAGLVLKKMNSWVSGIHNAPGRWFARTLLWVVGVGGLVPVGLKAWAEHYRKTDAAGAAPTATVTATTAPSGTPAASAGPAATATPTSTPVASGTPVLSPGTATPSPSPATAHP